MTLSQKLILITVELITFSLMVLFMFYTGNEIVTSFVIPSIVYVVIHLGQYIKKKWKAQ